MIMITWAMVWIAIAFACAAFCMLFAFACLRESKKAGWLEISFSDKHRLKQDFVFWMLISLIFWIMLYLILDHEEYVSMIMEYLPVGITDHGIRIGYQ